jgi:hypothetical protein
MELKQARETGLFSCTIEIGEFFGEETEAVVVKLREATARELAMIATNDTQKAGEAFIALLPSLITGSNFTSDGVPATSQEVANIILSKGTAYAYVMKRWQESLPLAQGKSAKSGR